MAISLITDLIKSGQFNPTLGSIGSLAAPKPLSLAPQTLSNVMGPKPTTTTIGTNVLLKGTPTPVDTPLPSGNSGVALPAGVQPTDLPKTSVLPAGANLSTPNLTPLAAPTTQPLALASANMNTSSGTNGLFGYTWTEIAIGLVVLILLVVAFKNRK